jgi:hypothetical protein
LPSKARAVVLKLEIHVKQAQLAAHHLKHLIEKGGNHIHAHSLLERIINEGTSILNLIRTHTAPPRFAGFRAANPPPDLLFEVRERSIADILDVLRKLPHLFANPHAQWEENASLIFQVAELFENLSSTHLAYTRKSPDRVPEKASAAGNEYFVGFLIGAMYAGDDLRPMRLYELLFQRSMTSAAFPSLSFCTERLFLWITREVSRYRSMVADYCCLQHCGEMTLDPKFHLSQRYFQSTSFLLRLYPVSSSRRPIEYQDRLRPLQEWQSYIAGIQELNHAKRLEAKIEEGESVDTVIELYKRALQYFTASKIGAMRLLVLAELGNLHWRYKGKGTADRYLVHVLNKVTSSGMKYAQCTWAVESRQKFVDAANKAEMKKDMFQGFGDWVEELEKLQKEGGASNPGRRKNESSPDAKSPKEEPKSDDSRPQSPKSDSDTESADEKWRSGEATPTETGQVDTASEHVDDSHLIMLSSLGQKVNSMPSFMLFLRGLNAGLPPLNTVKRTRLQALSAGQTISQSAFRNILFTYHPDKNGMYGAQWTTICLEVTKVSCR